MDTNTYLEKVIARACNLREDAGRYIFETEGSDALDIFDKAELAELDIRLPALAYYLARRYSFNHVMAIRLTLEHWRDPGKPVDYNNFTYLRGITKIAADEPKNGVMRYKVTGFSYSVESVDACIDCTGRAGLVIAYTATRDWLEYHYPGLAGRVDALVAIGATDDEISSLALQGYNVSAAKLEAVLPETTFD